MQEASRIHASSNPPRAIARVSGVDVAQLVLLAGLWGGSFVFMRVAAPAFGPVPLVALRVAVAAFILAPFLRLPDWRHMAPRLAWLGVVNSAVPFALFAHAALHLPAGFSAILNATAALWAVAIGRGLFGQAVDGRALAGVVAGVVGVMCMVGPQLVWSHQVDAARRWRWRLLSPRPSATATLPTTAGTTSRVCRLATSPRGACSPPPWSLPSQACGYGPKRDLRHRRWPARWHSGR